MATSRVLPKSKREALRRRRTIVSVTALTAAVAGLLIWWAFYRIPPAPPEDGQGPALFIQAIEYPEWFASSVLNLPEDLSNALSNGKLGIVLYFSRENCACCEVMKEVNLEAPEIVATLQRYFDVIAIDVWGAMPVTNFDGTVYTEARFAKESKADATPSMLFYNSEGEEIFRLRGYHEPYTFQAVLDYVLGRRPNEDFNQYQGYLFRPDLFDYFELHDNKLFLPPPYHLDRSKITGERPLAVFFERGSCAGCDFLHAQVLNSMDIVKHLKQMDMVQLDITDRTPVVTPDGRQTTAKQWAEDLEIRYTPTVIFFDSHGKIIERADSIIALRDLNQILPRILEGNQYAENHH